MSQIVTLICDIDGSSNTVTPAEFGIDGKNYTIDLCWPCRKELAEMAQPYVLAARHQKRERPRSRPDRRTTAAMRAWAAEHQDEYGWEIRDRGRMPGSVAPAYKSANGGAR